MANILLALLLLLFIDISTSDGEDIKECATGQPPRPTIPPEYCQDVNTNESCDRLNFAIECRNPLLYPIVLARCPKTCGLCDRPGALGRCPDSHPICPQLRLFGNACQDSRIAQMCMESCNITTCLTGDKINRTTTASASLCQDRRTNCLSYAPYCNHPRYSSVLRDVCPRTCRVC
ncbi:unnamed protein product [Dracunculus medinensis]|uniref:ShKT domain-containing protein n=1 Tax=Dracunculus medinensis TaxID=318479 RepID=A0A0N4UM87_DRAME|nr:unnamed protein product [Dracunculus medinensis]